MRRKTIESSLGYEASRLLDFLPRRITREGIVMAQHLREGRFQRDLAFIAGMSAILSGWEATLEHYQGSYGQRIMYTPVILSPLLLASGLWGSYDRRVARRVLPIVSLAILADGVAGFVYHVRGIARKPGGWRLPIANIVMGPPLFAPLLFGIGGYLGLVASFMRRADDPGTRLLPRFARPKSALRRIENEVREGRFQKHMASATAVAAMLSGIEALYSHYKNAFRYRMEWTPIIVAPVLAGTALAAIFSPRIAHRYLPIASALAIGNGELGFYYHARGVKKRSGGFRRIFYNLLYGPPLFAPLLLSASGFLGVLASLLRRER